MRDKSRKIVERILIEGELELVTPASLGNGDADGLTDISLLTDSVTGNALLTGSSVAGALRNYLRECEKGFWKKEEKNSICRKLFGFVKDKDGAQSCLIIDDAISQALKTELRDGVRIDGETRTAVDKAKFDLELLEAGTKFTLNFELLITENDKKDELVKALVTALHGFEAGEIHIGARKRRGYGECRVSGWKWISYDLKTKVGLMKWLKHEKPEQSLTSIKELSGGAMLSDKRDWFEINADFALDGSILIRSGSQVSGKYQPDDVHLRSGGKPIISGTSLAGALRHRALRIANTIGDNKKAKKFVDGMFGVDMDEKKSEKWASRLEVKERTMKIDNSLVQTRVKIDRFTGGAMDTALFDAAPIFSDGVETAVNLSFKLRFKHDQNSCEKNAEIGLLLLLLKDLWTSDLAIGGESSIGRGRLSGKNAGLNYKNGANSWHANLENQNDGKIKIDNGKDASFFNDFVSDFNREIKDEQD